MLKAVFDRQVGVAIAIRPIHRLQEKMLESQIFEARRHCAGLRIDEFQLVSRDLPDICSGLGTDANPIQPFRNRDGAIGFNGDRKILRAHSRDDIAIELEQRLSAGENNKPPVVAFAQQAASAAASKPASSKRPPPAPSTPTKSVSQN